MIGTDIFNQFLAPRKVYKPCGMFTEGHLILFVASLILLSGLLYFSRNITKEQINKLTKRLAVFIVILECIKIGFNFYQGYTWVNAWFPLAYCSIFIYSLVVSGYGKGKKKEMGDIFLAGAAIVAGAAYLIFPSTAVTMYPMWHYLSIYSMLFHTLMVYIGILYLCKYGVNLDKANYYKYVKFYVFFAVIANTINIYSGSNLMFLREPGQIPVQFLQNIYSNSPVVYTLLIFAVYLVLPYWITAFSSIKVTKKVVLNEN